MKKNNFF